MLTISSGHSASYLTDAVATGRENYYTGAVAAGEPPGRWSGRGAAALGLTGLVDTQDMTALYERFIDPRDPGFKNPAEWDGASTLGHAGRAYLSAEELYAAALDAEPDADGERREELRLESAKRARRNVAFLDATFSVQKSVTVLHAAFEAQQVAAERLAATASTETERADALDAASSWSAHRQAVEDAIWAGNNAALEYLSDKAGYSRVGHHGGAAGRFTDAHDWTVASFFQHDSRDHDPQLHIHNAILNRVQGADGQWRTLDGRALYAHRGAASAVGERTTEEHLAKALGVRFATRPDGKAREVIGVDQAVMDLFSSRRRAITKRTAELVAAFEGKFGRVPNSLELDRLQRQATFATRRAKSHDGESVEARLDRWDRELRAEVAGGLAAVADGVLALAMDAPGAEAWSPAEVIETALADVQAKKAAWTAPDLTRAISDALPDRLGDLSGAQVTALLDGLTAEALDLAVPLDAQRPGEVDLPADLRLANGGSVYDAPGRKLYATPDHIHTERTLVASATRRGAPALTGETVDAFVDDLAAHGVELGVDQAAAVRGVLTSGAAVESLVGPAGTGKSFVVGVIAKAWTDEALWDGQRRRVIGLATSQIATEVLAGEGLDARNIASWLGTQRRLAQGRPFGDDTDWRLRAGDLVVIDESAMADTPAVAEILAYAEQAGAKPLLSGDHRQLAAVGAAGAMELIADAGTSYELTDARRFTADWEKDASLRLRAGDATVLAEYHRHGRLIDAGTVADAEASASRAFLADTLAGKHSLLIVDTNEQAARLSGELRAELVRLGKVAEHGVPLGLQGTFAGVGDTVQARRNGWHLIGHDGNRRAPLNREMYTVVETRPDGSMVVDHQGERITLPADYVAEHLALGYASTVNADQGLTVDTSHPVITPATSAEAQYVMLTRGRHTNTAHVATRTVPDDAPDSNDVMHRSAAAVLAMTLEAADPAKSALATAVESAEAMDSVRTPAELLADAVDLATAGRTTRWLDDLTDAGHLTVNQRQRLAAEDAGPTLSRLLRRAELAGHDPRQVLHDAVTSRPLAGARQLANVLHHRITDTVPLDPQGDSYTDWTPRVDDPEWQRYLDTLAARADARRHELGEHTAQQCPQWAVEAFGPIPEDVAGRREWVVRAGVVAAHRELSGHVDDVEALGAAPKPGQVEAYASWRAAWRALDRPEVDRDELEMSDGQLHMRVRAYQRETTWAPKYVGEELAGTRQTAQQHRHTAELRRAEAQAATDEAERQRLETEAADADALATMLNGRAALLADADDARATWFAHTAETRAAHDRAKAELSARRAADGYDDEPVTADEWLAAHQQATAAEDVDRAVVDEVDLVDVNRQRANELTEVEPIPHVDAAEIAVEDIRVAAETEPPVVESDVVRVPSADETAETIARAQRALAEIHARHEADAQRAADEARAEQLARWAVDDAANAAAEASNDDVLERGGTW
ncbi:MobF family relaxase [Actinokineospora sp. HUAS TT18]|uniref:MobF family relaxase n=1 Tax=Actinokineospora sp. HUAS TT18 TaxID=3447451 RepID=UPI003F528727